MNKVFVFALSILILFVLHFSFPKAFAAFPCTKTVDGNCVAVDIETAIGTINTDPAKFTTFIYSVVLGLSGGIALVLIIIAGYKFMASQGNPEAIKSATEGLTSAVIGLLFIIFAFVILQVIGVDILRIPGFE
ncbi:MAG: hypothetical protein Q8P29_01485 [Candidatus Levybacteria bacterium]|nr:hypothetical protein [Candidatus Levybacteria bacterium]